MSALTSHLTIDVTNLRSADPGTGTGTDAGRTDRQDPGRKRAVLLNPQPLVAQILHRLRAPETLTILGQTSADSEPATSTDSD